MHVNIASRYATQAIDKTLVHLTPATAEVVPGIVVHRNFQRWTVESTTTGNKSEPMNINDCHQFLVDLLVGSPDPAANP